jgi:predicted AlkP superfamily pyrophosphatase or phosphodiesterase
MTSTARFATITLATVIGVAGLQIMPKAQDRQAEHVLLLSIDGLHDFDLEQFIVTHPKSALARLSQHGPTYTHASATMPSDSFPGLLAMVTGGTPRSTGVYYDDGYDRLLAAATGTCTPGARVQWKQNLDVLPFSFTTVIDELKLPRSPTDGCTSRVWPHQFPRVNNIFELVKASGGRTAWSDKHPAYEFLKGPSGTGIDDLFTPEITLNAPAVTTTNSFALTMAYDDMKVAAILNEIRGRDHTGADFVGVPAVFGMNFQAVSVGQKLSFEQISTAPLLHGGYVTDNGRLVPSDGLRATLEHTDESIGAMVSELAKEEILDSTMIIISAKHGNSPVDPAALVRVNPITISNVVNTVAPGLALLSADTGPLIWLKDQRTTDAVVAALTASMADHNPLTSPRIAGIISGAELTALFADPAIDSRTPDIVLVPEFGTVYTTAATKIADHGGFGEDDVHVALMVSQRSLQRRTISDAGETRQIACTILTALALSCDRLDSQQLEPSTFLPYSNRDSKSGASIQTRGATSVKPKR